MEVGSEFSQRQTITDTLTATYEHTLSGENLTSFVGSFTCELQDADNNMAMRTLQINGMVL